MRSGIAALAIATVLAGFAAYLISPASSQGEGSPASTIAEESITPPHEGRLEVAELEPEVHAEIPWPHVASLYGYGSLRLWGRPAEDQLHARLIVDVPATERRWEGCDELSVRIDGDVHTLPARYVGRPLSRGVYDALAVDVPIDVLRNLAVAGEVQGVACDDGFALDAAQRATLRRFLRAFDRLAVPAASPYDAPPELGPEIDLPPEEAELDPIPA